MCYLVLLIMTGSMWSISRKLTFCILASGKYKNKLLQISCWPIHLLSFRFHALLWIFDDITTIWSNLQLPSAGLPENHKNSFSPQLERSLCWSLSMFYPLKEKLFTFAIHSCATSLWRQRGSSCRQSLPHQDSCQWTPPSLLLRRSV